MLVPLPPSTPLRIDGTIEPCAASGSADDYEAALRAVARRVDGYLVTDSVPQARTDRDWPDGELFHRPMRGQNSMPSHARQIDTRDMWSVVHYIRQMQSVEPVAPPPATPASATVRSTSGPWSS